MSDTKPTIPAPAAEIASERRRTQRVQITMPILVRGKSKNQDFQEETHTVSVSAHGCLIRLEAVVVRAQNISLVNPTTAEELPCIVTFLGQKDGNKTQVGLEFSEPSPLFWRIAFPPEDWDPSERKKPTTTRPPALPRHKR